VKKKSSAPVVQLLLEERIALLTQ